MITVRKPMVALYVERFSQQWVVRNSEGNFWIVPSVKNPWEHRQQFHPTEESVLNRFPVNIYICLIFGFGQRKKGGPVCGYLGQKSYLSG
jgi:hypothetical protein